FKLAHALVKHGRQSGLRPAQDFDLRPLLDLVAHGTIADLVPLTGENRILVATGLKRLERTERPGLVALKAVADVAAPIGGYEVGTVSISYAVFCLKKKKVDCLEFRYGGREVATGV